MFESLWIQGRQTERILLDKCHGNLRFITRGASQQEHRMFAVPAMM